MSQPEPVVLVTGASSGLGAATARLLARRGWRVGVNFLKGRDPAEAVVGEIARSGGRAHAFQADVRDPAAVTAMAEAVVATFGRLDAVVSNANIPHRMASFEAQSWDALNDKLSGEISAAFNLAKAALGPMRRQGGGALVFISSEHARGPAAPGMIANGTAKAALDTFVRYLAEELGPLAIRANLVSPAMMQTPATGRLPAALRAAIVEATPLGHIADPEEVAGAVAFLLSDEARFVTGANLDVNGGFGLSMLPGAAALMRDRAAAGRGPT